MWREKERERSERERDSHRERSRKRIIIFIMYTSKHRTVIYEPTLKFVEINTSHVSKLINDVMM